MQEPSLLRWEYLLTAWSTVILKNLTVYTASKEIPRILLSPKVHYRIHKCSPPVPILSHLYPVNIPTPHLLKINLNIILPSTTGSFRCFFSGFRHQNPAYVSFLPHTRYMPCQSHSSRFYHPKNIG